RDGADTGHRRDRGGDVLRQPVLERARAGGEQDRDGHRAGRVGLDRVEHAELGDRFADLGIEDALQRGPNRVHLGGRHHRRHSADGTALPPRAAALGCGVVTDLSPLRASDWRLGVWRAYLRTHAEMVRRLERDLMDEVSLPLGWYDVLLQLAEAPEH